MNMNEASDFAEQMDRVSEATGYRTGHQALPVHNGGGEWQVILPGVQSKNHGWLYGCIYQTRADCEQEMLSELQNRIPDYMQTDWSVF